MDDLIQQGVNAHKSGDHESARRLFVSATKQNPNSERAWGWLYNECKTDQERIRCLKEITRINPENIKAKELLAKLTEPEPPLEEPIKQVTQKPTGVNPPIPPHQKIEHTPWYRSGLVYILLFIFFNPLWAILILTDKKQGLGIKIFAVIFGGFVCLLSLPILYGSNSGNTSGGDTSTWVPSGFEQWNNEIAYRPVMGKACSYSIAEACAHYEVFVRYGCSNSLYVEVAFMDSNSTQVDWSNDTATSLSSGATALLEFTSFNSSVTKSHITQISCY